MDKDVLTRRREFIFDHPPSHSIQEGCMVVYDGSVTGRVRKVFRDPYSENPDVYLVALQLDGEPPERIKSDTGIELVQTKHRNILLCALQKCELQEIAMHRTTAASSLDPPSKDSTKDVRQEDLVYDHPPDHPIQKESMVIYNHHNQRTAGVVKLIFRDKTSETPDMYMAALELSEALPTCTPGVYRELQLVQTPHGNILFCPLDHCALDRQRQKRIRHRVADDVIASGGNPSGPVNIPQNPHKELVFDHSPSHAIQEGSIVVYDGNVTGCVRSVFRDPNSKYPHLFLVALELLDPTAADTDIIFCPLDLCEPDHQFLETSTNTVTGSGISLPGQIPYKELAQTGATTPDKTAPLPDQEQQIPTAVKPHGDRMRSVDRAAAGHLFGQDSAQQIAHRGLIFNHSPAHPIQEGSTVVYNGTITGCVGKIFKDPNSKYPKVPLVALLLDEELPECTRGDYMGVKVIDSPSRNVLFCPLHKCELLGRARHKGPDKDKPQTAAQEHLVYDHPPDHPIQKESMVIYNHHNQRTAGVVKLIFRDKTSQTPDVYMVALELDQALPTCTTGVYRGLHLVRSARKNILFCPLVQCEPDQRFVEYINQHITEHYIPFAHRIETERRSPSRNLLSNTGACGLWKGIQGDINSCYMDSTLFSMFAFCTSFDFLLHRRHDEAEKLGKLLRESVVYPLRRYGHVASESMHQLRKELSSLGKVKGLTDREKDPEEFINLLLNDVFKQKPLIELSNDQTCNTFDIVGTKDETTPFPTVQKILETFCLQENLHFKKTPNCLILHMPRFGKHYKMYERIFPDLTIDLTHLTEDSHRKCYICNKTATNECAQCFDEKKDIRKITFCGECNECQHRDAARKRHNSRKLSATSQRDQRDHTLELSAVLCIETSHYVSFCKTAAGEDAPWVFFDSMAQREDGVNVPEVTLIHEASYWLSRQRYEELCKGIRPPPVLNCLFKDICICIYCEPAAENVV